MPPSFCPRKRIGTPPSTATRSMLRSPGRSVTIASTNLVGMPIKAAVCAFPMAVVTEAGPALFFLSRRQGYVDRRPARDGYTTTLDASAHGGRVLLYLCIARGSVLTINK